jgi:gliding motility-associated transport system ATP-binding protein
MTVRAFLNFCVRVKGNSVGIRRSQVDRVLQQCALEHMAHRHLGTLSKGYRQRVGLAQALLCDPEVLILDEPTVGLDPNQVIEMRDLISGMAGKRTILLSSHILHEVGLTCQRVVIIDKGNIIAEDTAAGLSDRIQGATRTVVRVGGPRPEVLSTLRALAGVKDVIEQEQNESGQEGQSFVVTSPDRTITSEIAQAIVSRGWALYELTPMTLGLEELFVRLTAPNEQRREAA